MVNKKGDYMGMGYRMTRSVLQSYSLSNTSSSLRIPDPITNSDTGIANNSDTNILDPTHTLIMCIILLDFKED